MKNDQRDTQTQTFIQSSAHTNNISRTILRNPAPRWSNALSTHAIPPSHSSLTTSSIEFGPQFCTVSIKYFTHFCILFIKCCVFSCILSDKCSTHLCRIIRTYQRPCLCLLQFIIIQKIMQIKFQSLEIWMHLLRFRLLGVLFALLPCTQNAINFNGNDSHEPTSLALNCDAV